MVPLAHPGSISAPPPVASHRFANGTDGWRALGEGATLERVDLPADPDGPAGPALKFAYAVDAKVLGLLVLPVEPGAWPRAATLSFTVRVSRPTTLVFTVQERGGGRWSAAVHCPTGGWIPVRLRAADFQRSRDAGAPDDADDRLDLSSTEQVACIDLANVSIRAEGALKGIFPTEEGPRTLWLRDVTVEPESHDLDGLRAPHLGWLPIGGASLGRVAAKESPLGVESLSATWTTGSGRFAGLLRPLPEAWLSGAKGLRMRVAATTAFTLLIQIEDAAGGKFAVSVEVPGGKAGTDVTIDFATIRPTGDSKTRLLDQRKIRQVLLADQSGLAEPGTTMRTLWTGGWEAW